jgi:hypothetical protein
MTVKNEYKVKNLSDRHFFLCLFSLILLIIPTIGNAAPLPPYSILEFDISNTQIK